MRHLIGAALLAAILVPSTATAADTPTPPPTKSCGGESGPEFGRCAWDGRHEGNGEGHSYVLDKNGDVVRVPHWVAHRLRYADVAD